MADVEAVLPYNQEEKKDVQVHRMFNGIASRYDCLNRILSLGMDQRWRRELIKKLKGYRPGKKILDIATGTGDLALMMLKDMEDVEVVATDISEEMMEIGRKKAAKIGLLETKIVFEKQDALSLTYADETFDVVTSAFGIRNFKDMGRGLDEMYRVLKWDGMVALLEFTNPERFPMDFLHKIYLSTVVPLVGAFISCDKSAYRYLPASIKAMPKEMDMAIRLEDHGLAFSALYHCMGGVCSLYFAKKIKE